MTRLDAERAGNLLQEARLMHADKELQVRWRYEYCAEHTSSLLNICTEFALFLAKRVKHLEIPA